MASQPDTLGLYPHSAPDGTPIPFDIVRPLGLIRQDFTAAASGNIAIPSDAELLAFMSTQECIVKFGAAATVPANGVHNIDMIVIPAGGLLVVDHNFATTFSVIALADEGTLYVQTIKKWKDLRKQSQFNRP